MLEPLVSVILPIYNEEGFISKTLDSLLNQTYRHYEVVVIDDGSTDRTGEILAEYSKSNERIKVLSKKHKPPSVITTSRSCKARRMGIEHCEGEWVLNYSAHVLAERNLVSALVETLNGLNDPDVVAVGCGDDTYCEGSVTTEILYKLWSLGRKFPDKSCYVKNVCYAIFRKDVIEKLGGFPDGCDCELNTLLNRAGYRKYFTSRTKVHYCPTMMGVKNFFKHNLVYGNGRQQHLVKYPDSSDFRKYLLLSMLTFPLGYGVGFFLGLLGVDVRRSMGL